MERENAARLKVIASMFIYGTIGLFVRSVPLPSSVIAMARGVVGAAFLLLVVLLRRFRLSGPAIRRMLPGLCATGAMLGFNWILLFESYRYTTVATATLCYYMAPIILVALSPLVFRERMTLRRLLCVLAALVGMAFVSGAAEGGLPSGGELRGVLLALGAAVLYALIVIGNKKLTGLSAYERTILQ
ncbi:MAG: DMT family transporter, partial [Oscillospiraceae bacterium]|nr:DMT family transporter [Oscillospiraceae bacterium]